MTQLAINGGTRTVPEGTIKPWPPIDDTDRQAVCASLAGTNHAFGPNCVALQQEFAAWNGNRFAVATNSGTAALHMCLAAVGCGCADEVIVPAYSWSSSATCVLHHNAIPVFVDIDFDTMNIDPAKIEQAISERTKALIVVHLHGLPAEMDKILHIARRHNLAVIEDACQAHGAVYRGRKVGTIGDCAAFSFNQNKCLCAGEGGMFVTDSEELFQKAKMLWSFGETRTPVESRDYHAYALGWMYRMSDLVAAFARAQLRKLDRYLAVISDNAHAFLDEIQGTSGLILPTVPDGSTTNWYNLMVRIDPDALGWKGPAVQLRNAFLKALLAEGADVGCYQRFILPAMTVFQAQNAYGAGCPWKCGRKVSYDPRAFPEAQRHTDTHIGMTTPLRPPNTPETARLVARAFRKVVEHRDELFSLAAQC